MHKKIFISSGVVVTTLVGSLLLPSCSAPPPSQTTTINVEVPSGEAKEDGTKDEIADLRASNDITSSSPGAEVKKTDSQPANRDGKDRVSATASSKKSASKSAPLPKSKSQLLDFYDRLPSKHFAAFGGINRRSLLNRKGAIVDYKYNFIEIPGSADERDGDLRALQITLFPNGKEPWCAVSRIVWPQGQTSGALDFYYGEADDFDRHPRTAAEGFFPYKLRKTDIGYESAWLPRRGLDIRINSAQDSELNGPIFRYNRNFGVGEAAFKRIYELEEG